MNAPAEVLAGARQSSPLAPGHRLGDFLVTRVVGQGGFGIVYEAEDLTLQRRVAIKEYMPAQLAARVDGMVNVLSSRYEKTFELGRRSFLAEARLLAQFHHPGLLEVLHFWEQNGTAYMVMPFYEGRTLEQVLANGPCTVDEPWLKSVIRPVLDALEHMHGEDCYHRDVSADNILIRNDGKALLLDLGAARRVIGESDRALTVMLKPGYAPIEQYADDPTCRQGPWTDIYAVAAVLHFAVTNRMPPASASRVMHDSMPSLAALAPPGYSRRFLEAIDRGLSIRPEQRPRTVGEFRSLLFAASADEGLGRIDAAPKSALRGPSGKAAGRARSEPSAPIGVEPAAPRPPSRSRLAGSAGVAGALLVAWAAWLALGAGEKTAAPPAVERAPIASPAEPVLRDGNDVPGTGAQHAVDAADGAHSAPGSPAATDAFAAGATDAPGGAAAAAPGLAAAAAPGVAAAETASKPPAVSSAISLVVGVPEPAGAAAPDPAPVAATGVLRLAVSPWGEVFVDGASRGVTPPLKQLKLDAGTHRIEIRNPAGPTWTRQIDVVAGQRTTVTHRFP